MARNALPTPPDTPGLWPSKLDLSSYRSRAAAITSPHGLPPLAAASEGRANRRGDPGNLSRQLGDTELSYYLPSRGDGVNDMYVHNGLLAHPGLLTATRVGLVWAIMLLRHPLLASTVSMKDYTDVAFVYAPPATVDEALRAASSRFLYLDNQLTELDLVDAYLNGPRTLCNDMLACLIVRRGTERTQDRLGRVGSIGSTRSERSEHSSTKELADADQRQIDQVEVQTLPPSTSPARTTTGTNPNLALFEVMLCATHYVGDEGALHLLMDELYGMLASAAPDGELREQLTLHLRSEVSLPPSVEDQLGLTALQAAVGEAALKNVNERSLGGQVLPAIRARTRRTVTPTYAFTPELTKRALATCIEHNVAIADVVIALCVVAWSEMCRDKTQPTMISSALDMRPYLSQSGSFHLVAGHINIVLPSLTPLSPAERVWYRATQAKSQTPSPSPLARAMFAARGRMEATRSAQSAGIDDTVGNPGLGLGISLPRREAPAPEAGSVSNQLPPPPAGKALMGVSVRNLDEMYQRQEGIELYALATGMRQRAGGIILFAYTLAGKLWLSLGYDENGFESGVVDKFWRGVLDLAHNVLLETKTSQ